MTETLKELSARYNPEADRIEGAKKGSLIWRHECGHRAQQKNGVYQILSLVDNQCLYLTIAALVLGLLSFAQFFFAISFIMRLYSEANAWWYAFRTS